MTIPHDKEIDLYCYETLDDEDVMDAEPPLFPDFFLKGTGFYATDIEFETVEDVLAGVVSRMDARMSFVDTRGDAAQEFDECPPPAVVPLKLPDAACDDDADDVICRMVKRAEEFVPSFLQFAMERASTSPCEQRSAGESYVTANSACANQKRASARLQAKRMKRLLF